MKSQYAKSKNRSVSVAVVEAIAAADDRSPMEVEPLYNTVDPEALNALFDGKARSGGTVEFVHCGYEVTVESSGNIMVSER